MIKNKRQYSITQSKLLKFLEARKQIELDNDLNTIRKKLHLDANQAMIDKLKGELDEFDYLISDSLKAISSGSLEELGNNLIRVRIAKGISQKELAERLEMKEQQIQRYEAHAYQKISFGKLLLVQEALEISVQTEDILIKNKTELQQSQGI